MTNFTFSLGNSRVDGLGMCFLIRAEDEESAIKTDNDHLDDFVAGLDLGHFREFEFISLYIGPKFRFTSEHIDDVYDEE